MKDMVMNMDMDTLGRNFVLSNRIVHQMLDDGKDCVEQNWNIAVEDRLNLRVDDDDGGGGDWESQRSHWIWLLGHMVKVMVVEAFVLMVHHASCFIFR